MHGEYREDRKRGHHLVKFRIAKVEIAEAGRDAAVLIDCSNTLGLERLVVDEPHLCCAAAEAGLAFEPWVTTSPIRRTERSPAIFAIGLRGVPGLLRSR